MSNLEKYDKAFKAALELSEDVVLADLKYQKIKTWDSIGHMGLISELEDAFDIEFETDDIIDFSSYAKGKEILKKYDVEI